jgi:hypothetical protein
VAAHVHPGPIFHRNWQGAFVFNSGVSSDHAWDIFRALKDLVKNGPKLLNRELYLAMEMPPWKKEANRQMRLFGEAVEEVLGKGVAELALDWASSQVWITALRGEGVDAMLGSWKRDTGTFCISALALQKLGIDSAKVEAAFKPN